MSRPRTGSTKAPQQRRSDASQLGHSAGGNPFGHVDVAVVVEAGVMRVDEFAVAPLGGITANGAPGVGCNTLTVVSQTCHDVVFTIQQCDAPSSSGTSSRSPNVSRLAGSPNPERVSRYWPSSVSSCRVLWARSATTSDSRRCGRRVYQMPCGVLNLPFPSPGPPSDCFQFPDLS